MSGFGDDDFLEEFFNFGECHRTGNNREDADNSTADASPGSDFFTLLPQGPAKVAPGSSIDILDTDFSVETKDFANLSFGYFSAQGHSSLPNQPGVPAYQGSTSNFQTAAQNFEPQQESFEITDQTDFNIEVSPFELTENELRNNKHILPEGSTTLANENAATGEHHLVWDTRILAYSSTTMQTAADGTQSGEISPLSTLSNVSRFTFCEGQISKTSSCQTFLDGEICGNNNNPFFSSSRNTDLADAPNFELHLPDKCSAKEKLSKLVKVDFSQTNVKKRDFDETAFEALKTSEASGDVIVQNNSQNQDGKGAFLDCELLAHSLEIKNVSGMMLDDIEKTLSKCPQFVAPNLSNNYRGLDPDFIHYDPTPGEQEFNITPSDSDALALASRLCKVYQPKLKQYAYVDERQGQAAIENFQSYRYAKGRKKGQKTIYDSTSREVFAKIVEVDPYGIREIEFLVEDIANQLKILINGDRVSRSKKGGSSSTPEEEKAKRKPQTWNKQPKEVKLRLYSVLKRVLWDQFRFPGAIVEFITKRLAYYTAQNRAKAKKTNANRIDDGSKLNRSYRKNILSKNPKSKKRMSL